MGKVLYRDVIDFPGYRVGNDGTVWSRRTVRGLGPGNGTVGFVGSRWRKLRPARTVAGYNKVTLHGNGKRLQRQVSRLVLTAFRGPCPAGMEACHNNGDSTDDRLDNLRWDTRKANQHDRIRHGTDLRGEKQPAAKLTGRTVKRLLSEVAAGRRQSDIAEAMGISQTTVSQVARGARWSSITGITYRRTRKPTERREVSPGE